MITACTWRGIQIVDDDDDDDNVGTNTPAVGEDPPPENPLLHEPHVQVKDQGVEDQGVEDQPVPAEPQPDLHIDTQPVLENLPPIMGFPLVIKRPRTEGELCNSH